MTTYDPAWDIPTDSEIRIVQGLYLTANRYRDVPGASKSLIVRGWYVSLPESYDLRQTTGPHPTAEKAFQAITAWLQAHGR